MLASGTLHTLIERLTRLNKPFDMTHVMSTTVDVTDVSITLDVDKHDTIMDSPLSSDLEKLRYLLALMVIEALTMQATAIRNILGTIPDEPLSGSGTRIPTYTVEQRHIPRARLRPGKKPRLE